MSFAFDYETMIERAAEAAEMRDKAARENLAKITEESQKRCAETDALFAKALSKEDEDHECEMKAEIERAKVQVEKEIRAKYAKEYGSKSWNDSKPDAYRELLHGLLGEK